MATLVSPPQPVFARHELPSYGTGAYATTSSDFHGPDFKTLHRLMKEIQSSEERRASRFVETFRGEENRVYNAICSRRRRTVQVLFNHRGRGRPARFNLDPQ